jgi:hypothetical protein
MATGKSSIDKFNDESERLRIEHVKNGLWAHSKKANRRKYLKKDLVPF